LSPERLYLGALSLSGAAALVSVGLPATQRGVLAACIVSATLGAALGSFSIDTFLLSRPAGWVFNRGRWWVLALAAGSIAGSAVIAAAITATAGVGSYLVAMSGAAALTVFNACSGLALRLKRFVFVYAMRAAGGGVLIAGYLLLYVRGDLDGTTWSTMWLAAQSLAAMAVGVAVLIRAWRFGAGPTGEHAERPARGYRSDLSAMVKLHVGICAQMLTFRLDQVLLARWAGTGPLGVYALAVAALEFAQSGAVVTAQRILADRAAEVGPGKVTPVVKAALTMALLAVVALAVLGRLVPDYRGAWLLGLLLLPGCLAVAAGKAWSASLLKQRGEQATSIVALVTLAVAVPAYLLGVSRAGAVGAALASSFVYAIHAFGSRLGLRRQAASPLVPGAV
jgi:hypothetical protein